MNKSVHLGSFPFFLKVLGKRLTKIRQIKFNQIKKNRNETASAIELTSCEETVKYPQ
jgi:hypothetical protein